MVETLRCFSCGRSTPDQNSLSRKCSSNLGSMLWEMLWEHLRPNEDEVKLVTQHISITLIGWKCSFIIL